MTISLSNIFRNRRAERTFSTMKCRRFFATLILYEGSTLSILLCPRVFGMRYNIPIAFEKADNNVCQR